MAESEDNVMKAQNRKKKKNEERRDKNKKTKQRRRRRRSRRSRRMNCTKIHIFLGPSDHLLTKELIHQISKYATIQKKILLITSENAILNNLENKSYVSIIRTPPTETFHLESILENPSFIDSEVIGITQASTCTDLRFFLLKCEAFNKLTVFVSGIDNIDNDRSKPNTGLLSCIPLCDTVRKITPLCEASCDGTKGLFAIDEKDKADEEEEEEEEEDDEQTKNLKKRRIKFVNRTSFVNNCTSNAATTTTTSSSSTSRFDLILGPMYSGKSTRLMQMTEKYTYANKKILFINHLIDNRSSHNAIKSHDDIEKPAIKLSRLEEISVKLFDETDVFGIDEAQFFLDLIPFLYRCEKHGKICVIAGLDGDYIRQPLGSILCSIPLCDTVVKLSAVEQQQQQQQQQHDAQNASSIKKAIFTINKKVNYKQLEYSEENDYFVQGESTSLRIDIGTTQDYQSVSRDTFLKKCIS